MIEGNWNDAETGTRRNIFWQHVRLANLAARRCRRRGTRRQRMGGRIGISSMTAAQIEIDNLTSSAQPDTGTYQVCSKGILGKFAKQLDIQMDDGNTAAGSMRAHADGAALGSAATATASIDEAAPYTVCMAF